MDLTDRAFAPPVHGERIHGKAVRVAREGEVLVCDLDSGLRVRIPLAVLTVNRQSATRVGNGALKSMRVA
jgi:hypothetical protein